MSPSPIRRTVSTAPPADLEGVTTLPGLLRRRIELTPEAEAYREHVAGRGWVSCTWRGFGARVERWARAIGVLAPARGARIAILLPNGVDAVTLDQAVLTRGCVPLPMHALDNPLSILYILADSGCELLVAQTEAQWRAIAECGPLPATLRQVVIRERDGAAATVSASAAASDGPKILSLDDWLGRGDATPTAAQEDPAPDDLAALVYTSGTTGKPKGVMLTHRNVVSNVEAVLRRIAPRPDDLFLSFLPLSHTFERTGGYYLPMAAGAAVAFARSTQHLAEDLKTLRPTVLISVPRIYERVFATLQTLLETEPTKKRLFGWAQAVGWRRFCRAQGLPVTGRVPAFVDAVVGPGLQRLVGAPLAAQFGGRLRVAVSGGAALSAPIARCFLGLGLPIVQGYGMTESAPVVSCNTPEDNDPATVGRPLEGVDVRIGENLELLVRGPNVMRGYWNRPEDTERALADGWLRTGDQASLDGGRIRIIGRVKEIIVTATGEKIAPADLEMAIVADPLFEQAWVFGDGRPFIACIVVLGAARWERLARSLALDPQDPASLQAPTAREAALARIRELTASFPHYAQPRAVALTTDPWTIESTLITPTLKLKRNNLQARYGEVVEALYRR